MDRTEAALKEECEQKVLVSADFESHDAVLEDGPKQDAIPAQCSESKNPGSDLNLEPKNQQNRENINSSQTESTDERTNELLVALAMHPDTAESDWIEACMELERRKLKLPCKPPERHSRAKQKRLMILLASTFAVLGALVSFFSVKYFDRSDAREAPSTISKTPYHLMSSKWHTSDLSKKIEIKLANAIEAKNWSEEEAARYLAVQPLVISNLLRGIPQDLSMEKEIQLLFALDKPISISFAENKDWERSPSAHMAPEDAKDLIDYNTRLLSYDQKNTHAYMERARAYEGVDQKELALNDYSKILEIDPDHEGALNNRALVYRDLGKYTEALHDVNVLMRRYPQNNNSSNRGLIYYKLGQYKNAIADFTKAIELEPQRPGPYVNRAMTYEKMGKYKDALEDYRRTLKADSTYNYAKRKIEELSRKI